MRLIVDVKKNNRLPKHYKPEVEDKPKTFYEVVYEFINKFYP